MHIEIIRVIHNLACACAVLLNTVVMVLIILKTPKKLR